MQGEVTERWPWAWVFSPPEVTVLVLWVLLHADLGLRCGARGQGSQIACWSPGLSASHLGSWAMEVR
jgi:hypothetical protein